MTKKSSFAAILFIFGAGTLVSAAPRRVDATAQPSRTKQTKVSASSKPAVAFDISAAKSQGNKSAPITMEVFSDFECPSCKVFFQQTAPPLVENYVNTGKVFLIHRDFPLQMHKYSRVAARYADAAAHIGKFVEVSDTLFNRQESWASNGDVDGVVASALTPSEMAKVRDLVQKQQHVLDSEVEKDMNLGNLARVTQTPTMVITYKGHSDPVAGAISYPILKQYLDSLLSR